MAVPEILFRDIIATHISPVNNGHPRFGISAILPRYHSHSRQQNRQAASRNPNGATIIPFRRDDQEATMAGDYFAFFFKRGF
jgi:hypothetical protein